MHLGCLTSHISPSHRSCLGRARNGIDNHHILVSPGSLLALHDSELIGSLSTRQNQRHDAVEVKAARPNHYGSTRQVGIVVPSGCLDLGNLSLQYTKQPDRRHFQRVKETGSSWP